MKNNIYFPVIILSFVLQIFGNVDGPPPLVDTSQFDEFEEWDGEQLAKTYCITCHIFPEPKLLPNKSWPYILDLMGLYFGFDDGRKLASLANEKAGADLYDVLKYPSEPTLSPFQWAAIRDFYETSAGSETVAPPPESVPTGLFETSLVYSEAEQPVNSFVRISPDRRGFFMGDEKNRWMRYDASGKIIESEETPGAIIQWDVEADIERATVIGFMHPSNLATGSILERKRGEDEWHILVEDLYRPVQSLTADFNGDGLAEWVINQFGHYSVGNLSLFERKSYRLTLQQELRVEPGSISSQLIILENEGHQPHILALNAQAREELTLYRNLGDLKFEPLTLLQQPPSFGYTQLLVADVTGDGKDEIITLNGDNADLPGPPLKGYHGVRIYRLDPGPQLEELAFLPVPGAFRAVLEDFDANGFTDIALISYFPDSRRLEQRFILFENMGDLNFVRKTLPEGALAPWMTLDAGDIDGDGDPDIVLGSAYIKKSATTQSQEDRLPAGLILRNRRIP